jgi:predicted CXXCH cytochrome family protein
VRLIVLAAVVALGAGAAAYFWRPWSSGRDGGPPPDSSGPPPDPRLTFDTPFRNVRPGVAYVGDATCAQCHKDLTDSFHRHPMGRSAILLSDPPDGVEKYDRATPPRFTAFGHMEYLVETRGDSFVHTEIVKDPSGREVARTEAPVVAGIGSGTRGRSYLCARDGSLWQSGASWFSEKQVWDLSPGFSPGRHGVRPMAPGCLFCHVNRVEPVAGSLNRYKEPFFGKQAAIGCERCHGPGQLHVAEQLDGKGITEGVDTSIVNPKHLTPELREDICRQCHFQGAVRIDRRGRDGFDFRPGLPLELFITVFLRHPALTDYHRSVGQVEQTSISRCSQASGGRFGCTSCHDPHSTPAPAAKDEFYRQRCLACHKVQDCRETAELRQAKNDACATCHMQKAASANIAHTAVTDHRILRRPASSKPAAKSQPAGEMPIMIPPGHPRYGLDEAERARDLGIGLSMWARSRSDDPDVQAVALRLLREATARHPDDADAWEALAGVLLGQGEWGAGFQAAESAVTAGPTRETALSLAADAGIRARRPDKAVEYARRALEINPGSPDNHLRLGQALIELERYDEAETELRVALQIASNHVIARTVLAVCLHRLGRARDARVELDRAAAIFPEQGPVLREMFMRQTR